MAGKPLIDCAEIDLSSVVLDARGLDRYLKQSGRFRMLDGILFEDAETKLVVGYKDVRADEWWAEDHIPGRPMFPGALQVELAAQIASYHYIAHSNGEMGEKFVGFGGVNNARFRRVVEPDCRIIVVARLTQESRRMFRYQTQALVDGALVSEAEILGVVI